MWSITDYDARPGFIILAQVQLSQLIMVKPNTKARQSWFYKVSQKSADFVICRADASVVAVIELDDKSHDNPKQAERDAVKSRALKDAGVRLLRTRELPTVEMIRAAIKDKNTAVT